MTHEFVADLAAALELPVLLVVGLRLGCLNHALLSAAGHTAASARPWRAGSATRSMPDFARLPENLARWSSTSACRRSPSWRTLRTAMRRRRLPAAAVAALMHAATRKQLT